MVPVVQLVQDVLDCGGRLQRLGGDVALGEQEGLEIGFHWVTVESVCDHTRLSSLHPFVVRLPYLREHVECAHVDDELLCAAVHRGRRLALLNKVNSFITLSVNDQNIS